MVKIRKKVKKQNDYVKIPKMQMDPNWRDGKPKSIIMMLEDEMENGKK